jgi:hypothetical protein
MENPMNQWMMIWGYLYFRKPLFLLFAFSFLDDICCHNLSPFAVAVVLSADDQGAFQQHPIPRAKGKRMHSCESWSVMLKFGDLLNLRWSLYKSPLLAGSKQPRWHHWLSRAAPKAMRLAHTSTWGSPRKSNHHRQSMQKKGTWSRKLWKKSKVECLTAQSRW